MISVECLGLGDVLRLHTLPALNRLVGDLLALLEGLVAVADYTGVVNEEVLATLTRGDEAVALILAEPLHCSLSHILGPPFCLWGPAPTKKPPSKLCGRRFHQNKTHVLLPPEHTTSEVQSRYRESVCKEPGIR